MTLPILSTDSLTAQVEKTESKLLMQEERDD